MPKILSDFEISSFRENGAVFLKNKFDIKWINKLQKGIEKDIAIFEQDFYHLSC